MRKALTALGLMVAMATPAFAHGHAKAGYTYNVRLNRALFDQVGRNVNVQRLCGPEGAARVDNRRNIGDAALAFLTIGLYTPTHVHVQCNTGGAPIGMR